MGDLGTKANLCVSASWLGTKLPGLEAVVDLVVHAVIASPKVVDRVEQRRWGAR
jgi:hypothetical protein